MSDKLENVIVKSLIENKEYSKKVSPYIDAKYFSDQELKIISKHFYKFVEKYRNVPTWEEIKMDVSRNDRLADKQIDDVMERIQNLKDMEIDEMTVDYLVDTTEQHFQEVSLEKCILKGAEILNSDDKKTNKHLLPEMMRDALKISFKNTVGQVYGDDNQIDSQYDYYHHPESKFPFPNWKYFNKRLMGGPRKKKLHIYLASTNVGKCLIYNTNVKIRNKKTGEIKEITMGDFFNNIKND